jgi:hypothetical protein
VFTGATVALVLGVMLGLAVLCGGREALEAGRALYQHRRYLTRGLEPPPSARPFVVWLGDSTIASVGQATYPTLVAADLERVGLVGDSRVVATPGLNFSDYYFLMGPVLDHAPDLVVLVAHLRMFGEGLGSQTFTDLASMIPFSELGTAVALPHQISLPRLLLLRLLRLAPVEHAVYLVEGLRSRFQEAAWWNVLGPRRPIWDVTTGMRALPDMVPNVLRAYDVPVGPRHPLVRMMAGAVGMATRRGVATLVIASPIPYEPLRDLGWYDPEVYARRFAAMRNAVEAEGGTFLDLHEALASDGFLDKGGHTNEVGTRWLAELIEPVVRRMLEEQAGRPAPVGSRPRA